MQHVSLDSAESHAAERALCAVRAGRAARGGRSRTHAAAPASANGWRHWRRTHELGSSCVLGEVRASQCGARTNLPSPTVRPLSLVVDPVHQQFICFNVRKAVRLTVAGSAPSFIARSTMASARPGWGSLRPPSARDIAPRKRHKGLDKPVPPFEHLVVLDFEWTADNRRRMEPCAEILQFPSVLVRLAGRDSRIVDEFDTFVRPTFNPTLTPFSAQLTGIRQADIDAAPPLKAAMASYLGWLASHGLASPEGAKLGHWAICTWSDADVGSQLATEARTKGLDVPACFASWVDLRLLYKRHFKTEPTGGLQACVERLGLTFDGRAHNGLVDSRNTAKIVVHMARGSYEHGAFAFCRTTRGLDASGRTYRAPPGSSAARPELVAKPAFAPSASALAVDGAELRCQPAAAAETAVAAAAAPAST